MRESQQEILTRLADTTSFDRLFKRLHGPCPGCYWLDANSNHTSVECSDVYELLARQLIDAIHFTSLPREHKSRTRYGITDKGQAALEKLAKEE